MSRKRVVASNGEVRQMVTVWVNEDLIAGLERLARRDYQNMTGLVRTLLVRAVRQELGDDWNKPDSSQKV